MPDANRYQTLTLKVTQIWWSLTKPEGVVTLHQIGVHLDANHARNLAFSDYQVLVLPSW